MKTSYINVNVQSDHKPINLIMKYQFIRSLQSDYNISDLLLENSLNIYYVLGKKIHFTAILSRSSLQYFTRDLDMLEPIHSVSINLPMSEERRKDLWGKTDKNGILSNIITTSSRNKMDFFNHKIIVSHSLRNHVIEFSCLVSYI